MDKWCRELKILYLQNNLIPRIGEPSSAIAVVHYVRMYYVHVCTNISNMIVIIIIFINVLRECWSIEAAGVPKLSAQQCH